MQRSDRTFADIELLAENPLNQGSTMQSGVIGSEAMSAPWNALFDGCSQEMTYLLRFLLKARTPEWLCGALMWCARALWHIRRDKLWRKTATRCYKCYSLQVLSSQQREACCIKGYQCARTLCFAGAMFAQSPSTRGSHKGTSLRRGVDQNDDSSMAVLHVISP